MFVSWLKSHIKSSSKLYDYARTIRRVVKNAGESSPLVYHCRDWTSNKFIRSFLKVLVTPYCVLKFFHVKDFPGRDGLAFVLIAKNEAPYIEEWINFHVKQGASHFFIYDNESTDNLRDVLKKYIDSGLVTYQLIKGKVRQYDVYNMTIAKYKSKFKYMAFLDADEFVFVRKNTLGRGGHNLLVFLEKFMKEHPNAGGIGINWYTFGSNGHEKKPAGGILENYTMRAEENFPAHYYIKTICDPTKVLYWADAHHPVFRLGYYNLDEDGGIIIHSIAKEVHHTKIRVNHYYTKSKEEYLTKKNRGFACSTAIRDMSDFYTNDQNIIHDTEILERA